MKIKYSLDLEGHKRGTRTLQSGHPCLTTGKYLEKNWREAPILLAFPLSRQIGPNTSKAGEFL